MIDLSLLTKKGLKKVPVYADATTEDADATAASTITAADDTTADDDAANDATADDITASVAVDATTEVAHTADAADDDATCGSNVVLLLLSPNCPFWVWETLCPAALDSV